MCRHVRVPTMWGIPLRLFLLALGAVLPALDRALAPPLHYPQLDAGAVGSLLGIISCAMVTLAGLVFSALTAAMSLSVTALSVRISPVFQADRVIQWGLGCFVGTYAYALLIALSIAVGGDAYRPWASTVVAVAITVGCGVMFIPRRTSCSPSASRACSTARTRGACASSSCPAWAPPCRAAGSSSGPRRRAQCRAFESALAFGDVLSPASRHFGDVLWPASRPLGAISAMVDIAFKALSPAVNDPSRAVQALDEIEDVLAELAPDVAKREALLAAHPDASVLRDWTRSWADYVAAATDEIRQYGTGSVQI